MPKLECWVVNCVRPSRTHGMCQAHYMRWRRLGSVLSGVPFKRRTKYKPVAYCKCGRIVHCRGLCEGHYKRRQRSRSNDARIDTPIGRMKGW